jgi:hypothetical protein
LSSGRAEGFHDLGQRDLVAADHRPGQRAHHGRVGHRPGRALPGDGAGAVTADPARGSTCSVATTVDAVTPGAAQEGKRAIWELSQVRVLDGGPDGVASTADNSLFAVQGVFVP